MSVPEVRHLLDPTPLPIETGYERLANGVVHVAARTDMRGCTGEMFEWWFRWRCDDQKYRWWHPVDHVSSSWQGDLRTDTHVGSEHLVNEYFTGLPAEDLIVQFRDPRAGVPPGAMETMFTIEFAQALLQHAYNEFTFLSRFLPSLWIAEHRDVTTPAVPW